MVRGNRKPKQRTDQFALLEYGALDDRVQRCSEYPIKVPACSRVEKATSEVTGLTEAVDDPDTNANIEIVNQKRIASQGGATDDSKMKFWDDLIYKCNIQRYIYALCKCFTTPASDQ